MSNEWNNEFESQNTDSDYAFQTLNRKGRPKTMGWSIIALVTGAVSVVTAYFGWSSLILGVLSIVFAVVSRIKLGYFDGKTIAGFILGIHGVLLGATVIGFVMNMSEDEKMLLWDYIRQMFAEIKEGPTGGSSF